MGQTIRKGLSLIHVVLAALEDLPLCILSLLPPPHLILQGLTLLRRLIAWWPQGSGISNMVNGFFEGEHSKSRCSKRPEKEVQALGLGLGSGAASLLPQALRQSSLTALPDSKGGM